jgi:ATP-dependent DNA helicase RecG
MKESQTIEWKETWRDEYLRWICGFANAAGGVLVIGRDDDGNPTGVKDSKKLLEDLPNKIRDVLGIVADVRLVTRQKKDLIEIHVEPYPSPISYKGEYHYRTGSTKQELKGAALERFLLQKRGRHWDDVPEPSFTVSRCSSAAFQMFRQYAARSGRMDASVSRDRRETILANLELTSKHGLKRAACLLFAARPERYVSGAWIKIGFFTSEADVRFQDEVHGDLFTQVEATMDLLRTKYFRAVISYQGLQRFETLPYPERGLREALLNAVVHKDYASNIPIQIRVHDDRLLLWNPGRLPESWDVSSLLRSHASRPFNPLLSNAFFRAGFIESWGRGIERIHQECRAHGIPPPRIEADASGITLDLRASADHLAAARSEAAAAMAQRATTQETTQESRPTTREDARDTGERAAVTTQEQLLALLKRNPFLTRQDLALAVGITTDGIKYHLEQLKRAGRLRRTGSTKKGTWEVLP